VEGTERQARTAGRRSSARCVMPPPKPSRWSTAARSSLRATCCACWPEGRTRSSSTRPWREGCPASFARASSSPSTSTSGLPSGNCREQGEPLRTTPSRGRSGPSSKLRDCLPGSYGDWPASHGHWPD
jgi:hypothetical protein